MNHFIKIYILIIIFVISGCKTGMNKKAIKQDSRYLLLANQCVKKGDLQKGRYYFSIAKTLSPDDSEIIRQADNFEKMCLETSKNHYQKGLKLSGNGYYNPVRIEMATQEFIMSLWYDATNTKALEKIKTLYITKDIIDYVVKSNDTFQSISEKIFKTRENAFLIAGFNDFSINDNPVIGSVLKIPVLGKKYLQKKNVTPQLLEAKKNLIAGEFAKVIIITEKIIQSDPDNKDAKQMLHAAWYSKGQQYRNDEQLPEALAAFEKLPPDYKDTASIIPMIKEQMLQTLQEQKDREDAACYETAKILMREKKYLEAMEIFLGMDPLYKGVKDAIIELKGLIIAAVEEHYRNGIKFYLNEQLENAIREWNIVLKYNTGHKKAKAYILKAQSLIEKLENVKH